MHDPKSETEYDPDDLITTEELARRTKFSVSYWNKDRVSGASTVPHIKVGKRAVRYRWGDVIAALAAARRRSTSDPGARHAA